MPRPLRFIHTSDVHLDSTSKQQDIDGFRNIAEFAFASVVEAASNPACDLFLIVGDLFDHGRIKSQDFEFVQEQLAKVNCPIVLIPGNHDVHDERSIWRRFDPHELGEHVHPILDLEGQVISFPELEVDVWGRAMDEHSPDFQPMQGSRTLSKDRWNIAMAHGQVVERRVNTSSSQITHQDISESGFEYVALGHVHVWQTYDLDGVHACYSGSPVEAFASSQGGFYAEVELSETNGLHIQKQKVDSRVKQEIVVTHGVFF